MKGVKQDKVHEGNGKPKLNPRVTEIFRLCVNRLKQREKAEEEEEPSGPAYEACPEGKQEEWDRYYAKCNRAMDKLLVEHVRHRFPISVFPRLLQNYIHKQAISISTSHVMMALPLLGAAGSAIGRSNRWIKVKDGYAESSCLWPVLIAESSEGKTPALNAMLAFVHWKQRMEQEKWERRRQDAKDREQTFTEPFPTYFLTDTTLESLRDDLRQGAILYANDELSSWCHSMGQYKNGNAGADKPAWTSCWSHSSISIGRRTTDRVYVQKPFVGVVGAMVPRSVASLNFRGHSEDGFMHRMLVAVAPRSPMIETPFGVDEELQKEYVGRMLKLYGGTPCVLDVTDEARKHALAWINQEFLARVRGSAAPDWLRAKYRKLVANFWRIALVLHDVRRVAETAEERPVDFQDDVVDLVTIERAMQVVDFFCEEIEHVQELLGEESPHDDYDALFEKMKQLPQCQKGTIVVRHVIHNSGYKKEELVLPIFAEWQRRKYGQQKTGKRGSKTFVFEP